MDGMKCEEFELGLEQDLVSGSATAHLEACAACRALKNDLDAIRVATQDLRAQEEAIELPERIWVSLRAQLVDEGILRDVTPKSETTSQGWWALFQRPALAGGFLGFILIAGILIGMQGQIAPVKDPGTTARTEIQTVRSAEHDVKQELLTAVNETLLGVEQQDPALTDALRRNLDIVDNVIDVCEKSVRDEPENQMARDYLYGAYEQKADLLATAMNHGTFGGLQ
jgi:hypothetical protein